MERWKPYKQNPNYEVGDNGEIRNAKTGRILKTSTCDRGYKKVSIFGEDKKSHTKKVGRMVAETYHECEHDGLDVIYIDGDRSNTRSDNVRWSGRAGRSKIPTNRKRVRCVETGIEYESVLACSKATGINASSISRSANGCKINITGGYSFEFV